MWTNYHTHTNWCDGAASVEAMAEAAVEKGFSTLGFSSHACFPEREAGYLGPAAAPAYVAEVRRVAAAYAGRLRVLCALEADFIRGVTTPDRARYASLGLDYLIGSIHYVIAPDGARVCVDYSPERLREGIAAHFAGRAEAFIRAYFAQEREMVATCDFDIIGHPDLVRKYNEKHSWFDENASWYREELVKTADAIAASGKIVEVNTGAMGRGWRTDAYPSDAFRALLRARGVRFVLSSDAHAPAQLDVGFAKYATAEDYVTPF